MKCRDEAFLSAGRRQYQGLPQEAFHTRFIIIIIVIVIVIILDSPQRSERKSARDSSTCQFCGTGLENRLKM